jgi:hypothetical protein
LRPPTVPREVPGGENGQHHGDQPDQENFVERQPVDVRLQLVLGRPSEPDLADDQATKEVCGRDDGPEPACRPFSEEELSDDTKDE